MFLQTSLRFLGSFAPAAAGVTSRVLARPEKQEVWPLALGAPDQGKRRDVGMKITSGSCSEICFGRSPKTHTEVAPYMQLFYCSGTKHKAPTVSDIKGENL
eukprot:4303483-Pyramimonas_sp.AAC.1